MENMDVCIHDEFCGGCKFGGVPYEEQLAEKEQEIRGYLEAHDVDLSVFEGIRPCLEEHRYKYRNKMEYTFGDFVKDGPLCLGMHKLKNFMSIITVDHCQLVSDDFNKILRYTLDFATERGYKHYHKRSHEGMLRNLIVRRGVRTGELLINLVTSSEPGFDEEAYVKGLLALDLDDEIVGILRTINDQPADAVNCDELLILHGRDYYMEEIASLKFKVSAFSFFQTNVDAAERLYLDAISLIDDFGDKLVFDLFCGTGTISQIVASKAREVVGVELVEEAVEAAKVNAELNGIENCRFVAGDVFKVLKETEEKPDLIIVDPPRMGIQPKAVTKIASYGVDEILYVSCNPKTLAINLKEFAEFGYKPVTMTAYDNFPGTKHAEAVCLLRK